MKAEGRAMDFIYFQMAIGKFLNRTKILFVVYETFCILDFVDTFGFGAVHKLRRQARGEGGFAKCL